MDNIDLWLARASAVVALPESKIKKRKTLRSLDDKENVNR